MNPMDLFKNLQNMQQRITEAQSQLKELSVTGTAGGDLVRVTMRGDFSVEKVHIDPEVLDPQDPQMTEDLVLAAVTDAQYKAKEAIQEHMGEITGGMNLPPDMFNMA